MDVREGSFHLVERAPGVSVEEIVEATAGALVVPEDVPEMRL
jgi:3-oxoacid CoA-transferase subunit B